MIGLKESLLLLSFFFYSKVAFCVLDLVFGFESHRIGTALQWFYSLVMDSSTPNVILYCVSLCSFFSLYLMFWQKIRVRSSRNMNYAKISFRPLILNRFVSGICMWLQQEIRERSHPSSWHDHRLLKCDFFFDIHFVLFLLFERIFFIHHVARIFRSSDIIYRIIFGTYDAKHTQNKNKMNTNNTVDVHIEWWYHSTFISLTWSLLVVTDA